MVLLRANVEAPLLDLALAPASVLRRATQIEAAAHDAARCLGPQTFLVRCCAERDILASKFFHSTSDSAEVDEAASPELLRSALLLLRHYERLADAKAEGGRAPSAGAAASAPEPRRAADPQSSQVFEKLAILLPVLASAVAAKFGLAEGVLPAAAPERELLRALLDSLTDQQLAALAGILRPEQLLAVSALRDRLVPPEPVVGADPRSAAPGGNGEAGPEPGPRPSSN